VDNRTRKRRFFRPFSRPRDQAAAATGKRRLDFPRWT